MFLDSPDLSLVFRPSTLLLANFGSSFSDRAKPTQKMLKVARTPSLGASPLRKKIDKEGMEGGISPRFWVGFFKDWNLRGKFIYCNPLVR